MKFRTVSLAAVVATGAFFAGGVAPSYAAAPAPAHAATATPRQDCDESDYVEVVNEMRHCFANAGSYPVFIVNVHHVQSGNNAITVEYDGGSFDLDKFYGKDFNPTITVRRVVIH